MYYVPLGCFSTAPSNVLFVVSLVVECQKCQTSWGTSSVLHYFGVGLETVYLSVWLCKQPAAETQYKHRLENNCKLRK